MSKAIGENKVAIINLISNLFSTGITILIGFFLSSYIVENLGSEANGFSQLANNFIMYASLITLALNSMAGRFISISYHNNQPEEAKKYYTAVILGNVFIILVLIVPVIAFVLNLQNYINIENADVTDVKWLFLFVFINFFANQILSVFFISTYVMNKLYLQNILNAVKAVLNAVMLIMLFSLFEIRIFYVSFVALILTLILIPISIIIKRRLMPDIRFSLKDFNFRCLKKLLLSGVWNTVNQCGNLLMTGLDLLMSNIFISPAEMGMLSVAKIIPNNIIQLATMVNTSFSPNLTILYAAEKKEELLKQLRMAMKISSVIMSVPIVVLCVFGEDFYSLWMPSLDARKLTILSFLTCMSFIPFSGTQALYNVYTTTNKLKVNSVTFVLGGVVNCFVVYMLLRYTELGVFAVAGVSSVIALLRNLLIMIPYAGMCLDLKWYEFYKDVIISLLCAMATFIVATAVNIIIRPDSWVLLIISVGLACIIAVFIEGILLLDKQERAFLITKFKRNI